MKRYATFMVLTIFLTAFTGFYGQKAMAEVPAGLDCLAYTEGIAWKQVSESIGRLDMAPFPEPGTRLQSNTRVYQEMIVIFSTQSREIKEGENIRFREVVTGIELCRKK